MNFTLKIFNQVKILLVMLFFVLPLPIYLTITILIFQPVRMFIWISAKLLRPDLHGFVTNEQAIFACETSSKATLNILVKTVWKGDINLTQLQKDFQDRILSPLKGNNAEYEGLKNTWVSFLGYAFWKRDPEFCLKNHIREYDHQGELAIPNPCTEEDVHRILGGLVEAPWNRERSPWEVLKVSGYQINGELHSILFVRFNHAVCDAYSLIQMFQKVFKSPFPNPKIRLGGGANSPLAMLALPFKLPYDTAKGFLQVLGPRRLFERLSDQCAMTSVGPTVNVGVIKKIKNHFKVNFAAVVYSAIFGGINRSIHASGQNCPDKLAAGFVIPKPDHPGGLCVHAAVVVSQWPLKAGSPEERLREIQKNFTVLSQSTIAITLTSITRATALLPICWRKAIMEFLLGLGGLVGITSFPVTTGPDYYDGHELVELTGCVGTWSGIGLLCTAGGVNNKQRLCFCINKGVFASEEAAQNLGDYVNQELEALLAATVARDQPNQPQ